MLECCGAGSAMVLVVHFGVSWCWSAVMHTVLVGPGCQHSQQHSTPSTTTPQHQSIPAPQHSRMQSHNHSNPSSTALQHALPAPRRTAPQHQHAAPQCHNASIQQHASQHHSITAFLAPQHPSMHHSTTTPWHEHAAACTTALPAP